MLKYILLIILNLSYFVKAQELLTIGEIKKINSEVLQTEREIWINLPQSYNNSLLKQDYYPVIYLLDAESNFTFLTGVVNKFENGYYQEIPESIIVGITNKNGDRAKDFTNINDKQFLKFIENELIPTINKEYRTTDYKLLIGHSFGGYFALKTLYNNPTLFNAYVAHDPSIWFNDFELKDLYKNISTKDFNNRLLMITQVGEKQNFGDLTNHYQGIKDINSLIKNSANKSITYNYVQYENEEHGSIPMIGSIDFLRWVYDGYLIKIKEIFKNPALIEDSFIDFSKKRNHTFIPQETYLNLVIEFCEKKNNKELAEYYTTLKNKYYN